MKLNAKTRVAVSSLILFGLMIGLGNFQSAQADDDHNNLPIHPDCADNASPRSCSAVIAELKAELVRFNQAFNPPNVDQIAKFYHPRVIHYISSINYWYRGRNDLRNNFFAPFVGSIAGATLDFSANRYQVVSTDMVITYGAIPGIIRLKDGTTIAQNPLPQTVTWVRNPEFDPQHPFVVVADHE